MSILDQLEAQRVAAVERYAQATLDWETHTNEAKRARRRMCAAKQDLEQIIPRLREESNSAAMAAQLKEASLNARPDGGDTPGTPAPAKGKR